MPRIQVFFFLSTKNWCAPCPIRAYLILPEVFKATSTKHFGCFFSQKLLLWTCTVCCNPFSQRGLGVWWWLWIQSSNVRLSLSKYSQYILFLWKLVWISVCSTLFWFRFLVWMLSRIRCLRYHSPYRFLLIAPIFGEVTCAKLLNCDCTFRQLLAPPQRGN